VEATEREEAHPMMEEINNRFNLPSTRMSFLWYHTAVGFPQKETFLNAIQKGN
jgi:hypothetical protein